MQVVSNPNVTYKVEFGTNFTGSAFYLDVPAHGVLDTNYLAPATNTYAYADITSSVISIEFRRGASRTTDRISAGSGTVRLYDPSRQFDPTNTAGAYYGKLLPGFPIKISANTYSLFTGWITDWRYEALPGKIGEAVITFTDSLALYALATLTGAGVFSAELSSARIQNLLDLSSFAGFGASLQTGDITVSAKTYAAGTRVLDAILDTAQAEWGPLFANRSGLIAFFKRNQGAATAAAKFAPTNTAGYVQYAAIASTFGEEVFPVVQVTDDAGAVVTAFTSQYLLTYGSQTLEITGGLLTNARASTLATYLAGIYQAPAQKIEDAQVQLVDAIPAARQNEVFQLDVNSAVEVTRTFPTGTPTTSTTTVRVQTISHRISRQQHVATFSFGLTA